MRYHEGDGNVHKLKRELRQWAEVEDMLHRGHLLRCSEKGSGHLGVKSEPLS